MKTPFLTLSLAACLGVGLLVASPAAAQTNYHWDDDGNTASKLWSDAGNWDPDGTPGQNSNVVVGNLLEAAGDITLFDDNSIDIRSLEVAGGASIFNSTDRGLTDDYRIDVARGAFLYGDSRMVLYGGDANFPVFGSYALDTGWLDVEGGAELVLDSTTPQGAAAVRVRQGSFVIGSAGKLTGTGRLHLDASTNGPTTLLQNKGVITVNTKSPSFGSPPAVGTLQITAASLDAQFDWDGEGSGVLNINGNQTLDIDVGVATDLFNGAMNLATDATLDVATSWAVGSGAINISTPDFSPIAIGQDPSPGAAAVITGGTWGLMQGSLNLDHAWDSLQIDSPMVAHNGSTINNRGTITFNAPATIQNGSDFNMIGGGASLVINSNVSIATPDFNLDGAGAVGNATTINAGGSLNLDLGNGADGSFDHTINLRGALNVETLDNDWALAAGATLNTDGGGNAVLSGETFQALGVVSVTNNTNLTVVADTEYGSTADVLIEAGSILKHGTASYDGGSYTGGGIFKKGDATVIGDTTWEFAAVDIDDGTTAINNGASLVVRADNLDVVGNDIAEDEFDGINSVITVKETGDLTLGLNDGGDVRFDFNSKIRYEGGATPHTFLKEPASGSALVFRSGSELEVEGAGVSEATIKFEGGVARIAEANGRLRLRGGGLDPASANRIEGGLITGPGELQIESGRALYGHGIINPCVRGDGTAQLIAMGGQLTLSGLIEDIGQIGTSGGSAVLNVTIPWNTNVADRVVLDKGKIVGAVIANNSPVGITGQGEVASQLVNNSRVTADVSSGLLLLSNHLNDWDGVTNTGTLRARGGTLRLEDDTAFAYHGTVEAAQGTVQANGFGLQFQPGSMLRLEDGVYNSDAETAFGGSINVLSGSPSAILIKAGSTFQSTSIASLADTLQLEGSESLVEAGATFTGVGQLHNTASNNLVLADGVNIGVAVRNSGRLGLGVALAEATLPDYQQDASGLLEIDLGGTNLVDYDRLDISGEAQLDGVLELSFLNGFEPSLNDAFTVLTALSGINGIFGEIDLSGAKLDAGFGWEVLYGPTTVQLAVVELPGLLGGDYNSDGIVDAADYTVWRDSLGTPTSLPNDPTPGAVTQSDYDVWRQNFGATGVGSIAAVPEPAAALLLSVGLTAIGCRRRR